MSLLDFVQSQVPVLAPEYGKFHLRHLAGSVRRLWLCLERPPEFDDLNEETLRGFASWLRKRKFARETANDTLKYVFIIATVAAKFSLIPQEIPYLQLDREWQLKHCGRPSRRPGHNPNAWHLIDLLRLFDVVSQEKSNVGGIPAAQWWGSLLIFLVDARCYLHQALALRWRDVNLDKRTVRIGDRSVPLQGPTRIILLALKSHEKPVPFPAPSHAKTAIHTIYRRMDTFLVEGGLRRRLFRSFDRLRKVKLGEEQFAELAGKVVILPAETPDAEPPAHPGQRRGRRIFYSPGLDQADTADSRNLTPDMTLNAFYRDWYEPVILDGRKQAAIGTKGVYRESLGLWEGITGDPPISAINDITWGRFCRGLRSFRYIRGEAGEERALAEASQAKAQKIVRSVLNRTFKKGLLAAIPEMIVRLPKTSVKPTFTLEEARKICEWIRSDAFQLAGQRAAWWLAYVATAFYTGLRTKELLSLRWRMLQEDHGQLFLHVPSEIVFKTGKGETKAVHPCLKEALDELARGKDDEPILEWQFSDGHIWNCHQKILRLAGVDRGQSPHSWRRSHATEIALAGYDVAVVQAQKSLSHGDRSTTERHYLAHSVATAAILRLPRLWGQAAGDRC